MELNDTRKIRRVLIKMTFKEFDDLKQQAVKYTKGNVSNWIRYSSKLEPKKEDIKDIKKTKEIRE